MLAWVLYMYNSVVDRAKVCCVMKILGHRPFQLCPLAHERDVDWWVMLGEKMDAA